jgi:hypothetical protein
MHKNFSILIGLRAVQLFEIQCQKKYSANFIDHLVFLIALKYETMTKIANKIQQFPTEIIQTRRSVER